MRSYEVVVDNSKMLANCFEENPLAPFTLELPGWHGNFFGGGGADDHNEISTPDTSSFVSIPPGGRLGLRYFSETDHGNTAPPNIYMPTTPTGYSLTQAKYVVIAKRAQNDGTAYSPYNGNYPAPTTVPFLYCESSGVTNNSGNALAPSEFVFNNISVGSWGEVECSAPEVLSRFYVGGYGLPANRLWNEDFIPGTGVGSTNVDVAYFAIRLYYDPS